MIGPRSVPVMADGPPLKVETKALRIKDGIP
jgi:hypothetical protein